MQHMRRCLFPAAAFLLSTGLCAQTTVIKKTAVKSDNYGVSYFLPKTDLIVTAEISRITRKAGPYFKYAQKYLGIDSPVKEDQVCYALDGIRVTTKAVPDESKSYLIAFKAKTTAPFVCLTQDGLICTVNADYEIEKSPASQHRKMEEQSPEIDIRSVLTEEHFQAGSISKMAEIAARQIYRLRESRTDLLTGETQNVPKDGAAMKLILEQIGLQEKVLMEQFSGSQTVEKQTYEVLVSPVDEMDRYALFRFSEYLGIVKSDDLSGAPVCMTLKKRTMPEPDIANAGKPAATAKARDSHRGLYYNVPAKVSVEITSGAETLYSGDCLMGQFGSTDILLPEVFEDKKAPVKIYFYPETGGIKQIIQI
jgi:hypothetical protein